MAVSYESSISQHHQSNHPYGPSPYGTQQQHTFHYDSSVAVSNGAGKYSNNSSGHDPLSQLHQEHAVITQRDFTLKRRIRQIKAATRICSTLLSIASFVPVAYTLAKYENTKDVIRAAPATSGPRDGQTIDRNAWSVDTKVWPTIMYTAVGAISFIFNSSVLASYFRSIRRANQVAAIMSYFDWLVLLGNLGVWIAAAVIYRQQKDLNGKSNDLWGWACSPAAQKIQQAFNDQVHYNSLCNAQSISWYFGVAQGSTSTLSVFTFVMAIWRMRVKKTRSKREQRLENVAYELVNTVSELTKDGK